MPCAIPCASHKGLSTTNAHISLHDSALHKLLRVVHRLCIILCMTNQPHLEGVPEWTLGDRLRKSLDHSGVGYQEMADYLGLRSTNTIGNYIAGRTKPSVLTLRAWSELTGVSLTWITYGDTGGPAPRPSLRGPSKEVPPPPGYEDPADRGTGDDTTEKYPPGIFLPSAA
jgi:transcriptional regulator with XRE-family HTH domain